LNSISINKLKNKIKHKLIESKNKNIYLKKINKTHTNLL